MRRSSAFPSFNRLAPEPVACGWDQVLWVGPPPTRPTPTLSHPRAGLKTGFQQLQWNLKAQFRLGWAFFSRRQEGAWGHKSANAGICIWKGENVSEKEENVGLIKDSSSMVNLTTYLYFLLFFSSSAFFKRVFSYVVNIPEHWNSNGSSLQKHSVQNPQKALAVPT